MDDLPPVSESCPYEILECTGDDCRLRIPATGRDRPVTGCPLCGRTMRTTASGNLGESHHVKWSVGLPCDIHVLLDNVRSTFNVGAILRVADGAGLAHVHLCGFTPTPGHRKLAKTALGAEDAVRWTYYANALDAAGMLQASGVELWALENQPESPSLFSHCLPRKGPGVALIVGNEVTGVDPGLLALADHVAHLPMDGLKGSLNVAVSLGIAAYWLRGQVELATGAVRRSSPHPSSTKT